MSDGARQLSVRQAINCELAKGDVCRCRCGGALHGAGRATSADGVYALPEEDPHHIFSPAELKAKKAEESRAKWKTAIDAILSESRSGGAE